MNTHRSSCYSLLLFIYSLRVQPLFTKLFLSLKPSQLLSGLLWDVCLRVFVCMYVCIACVLRVCVACVHVCVCCVCMCVCCVCVVRVCVCTCMCIHDVCLFFHPALHMCAIKTFVCWRHLHRNFVCPTLVQCSISTYEIDGSIDRQKRVGDR